MFQTASACRQGGKAYRFVEVCFQVDHGGSVGVVLPTVEWPGPKLPHWVLLSTTHRTHTRCVSQGTPKHQTSVHESWHTFLLVNNVAKSTSLDTIAHEVSAGWQKTKATKRGKKELNSRLTQPSTQCVKASGVSAEGTGWWGWGWHSK